MVVFNRSRNQNIRVYKACLVHCWRILAVYIRIWTEFKTKSLLTLLTLGTNSCNALIRSAILSLRNCTKRAKEEHGLNAFSCGWGKHSRASKVETHVGARLNYKPPKIRSYFLGKLPVKSAAKEHDRSKHFCTMSDTNEIKFSSLSTQNINEQSTAGLDFSFFPWMLETTA